MAWEQKNGCRFFTHSYRVNGRVRRRYYGTGVIGDFAEAVLAMRRTSRQGTTAARQVNTRTWDATTTCLRDFIAATDHLIAAALLTAGYHQHDHGEWRFRSK